MSDSNGGRRWWIDLFVAMSLGAAAGALSAYPRLSVIEDHLHSIDGRFDRDELRLDTMETRLGNVEVTNGTLGERVNGIDSRLNMFLAPYRGRR